MQHRSLFESLSVRGLRLEALLITLCVLCGSACSEGHELPGTRAGAFDASVAADAGDGDGDGDGMGNPDSSVPISDASTGEPDPVPPACEVSMCEGATTMLGDTPGCCTADEVCGLDLSAVGIAECAERDAPGANDPRCVGTNVFGIIAIPGCCPPSGVCGLNLQDFVPLGCFADPIQLPIVGLISAAPVPCTPPSNTLD